jgi:hypothetical protein
MHLWLLAPTITFDCVATAQALGDVLALANFREIV